MTASELYPALESAQSPAVASALEAKVPADETLPKSSSSAIPDLPETDVPRLKAKVHRQLSPAEMARIPLSEVRFRPLRAEDMEEMVALHTEWFPLAYEQDFYDKSVGGQLFSLVATRASALQSSGSVSSSSPVPAEGAENVRPEESILGMITVSMYCEHHCDAIVQVLGADCEALCRNQRRHWASSCSLAEEGKNQCTSSGALAYILTLGVAEGFRRRGLAKELLRQSIEHVDKHMPDVQALYLHVVTYNKAAIELYESASFLRIEHCPRFYFLHGHYYDSYLYVLYIHGGRPPWKWRLRNFWQNGLGNSWSQWVKSAWKSMWPLQRSNPQDGKLMQRSEEP